MLRRFGGTVTPRHRPVSSRVSNHTSDAQSQNHDKTIYGNRKGSMFPQASTVNTYGLASEEHRHVLGLSSVLL